MDIWSTQCFYGALSAQSIPKRAFCSIIMFIFRSNRFFIAITSRCPEYQAYMPRGIQTEHEEVQVRNEWMTYGHSFEFTPNKRFFVGRDECGVQD